MKRIWKRKWSNVENEIEEMFAALAGVPEVSPWTLIDEPVQLEFDFGSFGVLAHAARFERLCGKGDV